jgi:general stress protein YciG
MSSSLTPGQKSAAKNKKRHGKNYYAKIGRLGGKKSKRTLTHEQASAMGELGGRTKRVRHWTDRQRQQAADRLRAGRVRAGLQSTDA